MKAAPLGAFLHAVLSSMKLKPGTMVISRLPGRRSGPAIQPCQNSAPMPAMDAALSTSAATAEQMPWRQPAITAKPSGQAGPPL